MPPNMTKIFRTLDFYTLLGPNTGAHMSLDHWGLSDRIDRISLVTDAVLMSKRTCIAPLPLPYRFLSFTCLVGDGDPLGFHRWVAEMLQEAGGEFAAVPVRSYLSAAGSQLTTVIALNTTGDSLRNCYRAWRYCADEF